MTGEGLQSVTIGLAFAVFLVWMERKGRIRLFAMSAAGDYQLANTRGASSGGSSAATASTSPDSPQGNLSTQPPPQPGATATPGAQASGGYAPYQPPGFFNAPTPANQPQVFIGGGSTAANQGNLTSPPAPY